MLLRNACFAAVGQFELLLRNAISEQLSTHHGSHPYYDLSAFKDPEAHLKALVSFASVYDKSKDQRAKHYRQTYGSPFLPPIWTMKEFITFGAASHIYPRLASHLRTAIASQFGVSKDTIFHRWIECLVDLRNLCAHHDRIFNRSFQKQPSALTSAGLPLAPPNKLKALVECLDYMLEKRGTPVHVTKRVGKIIARYPQIQPAEVGY